ncbi:MAG: T9SS type A sorting domain-containing protein [Saprospiraceae bacterium]
MNKVLQGATYQATFIKGLPNQNARKNQLKANLIATDGTVFHWFGFLGYFEDLDLTPPFPDFFIPNTNTFGMAGLNNRPFSICLTNEGDIMQGTQSRSFLGENSSHFSFIDASGFVKWEKQFQVDGRFVMPEKAVFDEEEDMFWIFGFTIAEDRSTTHVFIQVDLNGEMLFEKRFNEVSGIPYSANIIDVVPSISGEILLLVDVLDPDENYAKMLAFDKDGKVIREKIISDLRVDVDNLTVRKVKEDKHGNIFILYMLRYVPTMLKLDSNWNTQYINTYRRSTSGESYNPNHFTILENGEISLMGDFYKTLGLNSFLYHPELVHFNSEFELKEEIPIDFEPYDGYVTGFAGIDSTFYISGFFEKDSSYRSQVYWMSVDYDGNILEKKERDAFGASLRSEEMVNDKEGNFVINYFNYPIRGVAWTHTGFWKINEGISSLGPSNFVDNLMPIVYPNPAKDKIFFKGIKPEKIKIFSSDGRVLIETTFDTEGLDVGDLNGGNYYILLFLNGQKYIRQFSKI